MIALIEGVYLLHLIFIIKWWLLSFIVILVGVIVFLNYARVFFYPYILFVNNIDSDLLNSE